MTSMGQGIFFNEEESAISKAVIGETIEIEATLTRVIFEKENYVIGKFIDAAYMDFTVLGNVPFELKEGRNYRISGEVEMNKRSEFNERQIKLQGITILPPKGEIGIIKYLQSLKGLQARSYSLYETFKDDTIKIMKEDPERVAKEVKGISIKQALEFQTQLIEAEDSSETVTFLLNVGLTMKESNTLFKEMGEDSEIMIRKNPYILGNREGVYPGFGFRKMDKVAKQLNFDMQSEHRVKAGIRFAIENQGNFGHCYTDWDKLVYESIRILSLPNVRFDKETIENAIESMLLSNDLIMEGDNIYTNTIYNAEMELGSDINRLAKETEWKTPVDVVSLLNQYLETNNIELEIAQRKAVIEFTKFKGDICILNGSAGSGKTFTMSIILKMLQQVHWANKSKMMPRLLAPTGKAAKVLQKSVKMDAMTIHRALRPEGHHFNINKSNPLEENVIVVDESSMLDTELANALLESIETGSKLIFLGDTNQIPSIGAGAVLKDLITSKVGNLVTLTVPKRQKEGSLIYLNTERILSGLVPEIDNQSSYIIPTANAEHTKIMTIKAIKQMVENDSPYQLKDIQVLSPMRMGQAGTRLLNYEIQQIFNPSTSGVSVLNYSFEVDKFRYELRFKAGDKVIQKTNNGELNWYKKTADGFEVDKETSNGIITNGEQGVIEDIVEEEKIDSVGRKFKTVDIIVEYEDGYVIYHGKEKSDLDHAYAISIHKSQGSQWPVVINVLSMSHQNMLENNLFYTAMSRTAEVTILVAERQAVQVALNTNKTELRKTTLVKRIEVV